MSSVSVLCLTDASRTYRVLERDWVIRTTACGRLFLQAQPRDLRHLCVHPLLSHQTFIEGVQCVRVALQDEPQT